MSLGICLSQAWQIFFDRNQLRITIGALFLMLTWVFLTSLRSTIICMNRLREVNPGHQEIDLIKLAPLGLASGARCVEQGSLEPAVRT